MEVLEPRIRRLFILNPIRRNRVVWYVLQIRISEVEKRIQDRISQAPYHGVLFPLGSPQTLKESSMIVQKLAAIVEDVANELVQPLRRYDRRVGLS